MLMKGYLNDFQQSACVAAVKSDVGGMVAQSSRLRAPLVIAVTGHRDLRKEDCTPLRAVVERVLHRFRDQYPATPLVLLSSLAEGADRLVAGVALGATIGARLVVPLPMPREEYERDFQSPESLAEFRELLSRADNCFALPLLSDIQSVNHPGPARDRQYEEVGKYIARECQILIALWDGVNSHKVGGTSAVVGFQTEGLPNRITSDLQPPELFPVYQILTPRASNPEPAGEPFSLKEIYPSVFGKGGSPREYYHQVFSNLEEFNACMVSGGETLLGEVAKSESDLLGNFERNKLSESEQLVLGRYAIADSLAMRFQGQMTRKHWLLHWYVFFAFSFFVLFAHCDLHPWALLVASLALLLLGYWEQKRAVRLAIDNKRQDYRAVAEGCRVKLFWQVAGVEASVPDKYLGKQRTELDWIRNGLRGWSLASRGGRDEVSTFDRERLDFVLNRWVGGQLRFFESAASRNRKNSERMEFRVRMGLQMSIVLAFAILLGIGMTQWPNHELWSCHQCERWLPWAIVVIDLLLAGGALYHHANQRMAHAQIAKQYDRMKAIFQNASDFIGVKLRSNDMAAIRECLQQLGQEALAENGDWVLLHRERPLELPHP